MYIIIVSAIVSQFLNWSTSICLFNVYQFDLLESKPCQARSLLLFMMLLAVFQMIGDSQEELQLLTAQESFQKAIWIMF